MQKLDRNREKNSVQIFRQATPKQAQESFTNNENLVLKTSFRLFQFEPHCFIQIFLTQNICSL